MENGPGMAWGEEDLDTGSSGIPAFVQHTARDLLLAHTALLDNVVVTPQVDSEVFRLVKIHIKVLEQWHEQHTGWRVQRGSTFFRLERHLHMPLPVYVDEKLKEARDFACLAWILWFAEKRHLAGSGKHQQFLLSQLAEDIQVQTRTTSETGLDMRNVQDRYSMRRALEYLIELGCLQMLEGEIKKWSESGDQEQQEVLFEFTPLAHSLIEALNEQRILFLRQSLREAPWPTPSQTLARQAGTIPPLVRAWRTLLLGPMLLRYDDAEAFLALVKQTEQVHDELGATFGWSLELNRDYACIVRGGGISMGAGATISFNGAFDQIVLLLCGAFREEVQAGRWISDAYGCVSVTQWEIFPLFNELRQRYGSYWGTTVQNMSAEKLLAEIYPRMHQTGLLRGPDAEGRILLLPTAARYSVSYMPVQETTRSARTRVRERKKKVDEHVVEKQPTLFDWSEPVMGERVGDHDVQN